MSDVYPTFTADELASEEWRPIPGYLTYEISSLGRARRSFNAIPKGRVIPGNILRPGINSCGYMTLSMIENSNFTQMTVHKAVCLAFIGERPHGLDINHIDGNKLNNRKHNLEYVSRSENIRHADRVGLRIMPSCEHNPNSKLNNIQSRVIRHIIYLFPEITQMEIGNIFGVSQRTISLIKLGKAWKKNW